MLNHMLICCITMENKSTSTLRRIYSLRVVVTLVENLVLALQVDHVHTIWLHSKCTISNVEALVEHRHPGGVPTQGWGNDDEDNAINDVSSNKFGDDVGVSPKCGVEP